MEGDWFEIRPARNHKPATYRCPLCGAQLPALSEHMLIVPDGDRSRRRHAHTACVMAARKRGELPTPAEHRRAERAQRSERAQRPEGDDVPRWRRLLTARRRRASR